MLVFSVTGKFSFLALKNTVTIDATAISIPGITPAINNVPTDRLLHDAYKTNGILGGIIGAQVDATAVNPEQNAG
jgi:hypothetical protein